MTDLIKAGSGPAKAAVEAVEPEDSQGLPTPPDSPHLSEVILPEDALLERKLTSSEFLSTLLKNEMSN